MSAKSTLRWVLLAAALLAYIMFFESRRPDPRQVREESQRLLQGFDPALVDQIEIVRSNITVRAEKTGDQWRVMNPPYPAQADLIQGWLTRLDQLRRRAFIPATDVLQQPGGAEMFGLQEPQATLSLHQGDERWHFRVGSEAPLGSKLYLQFVGEGSVLVTESTLLEGLPATANDWRDREFLAIRGQEWNSFQVVTDSGRYEITRQGQALKWRLRVPRPARVAGEQIIKVLQQLVTLRVEEFVEDAPGADLAPYGLQQPFLTLSFQQGTNLVFRAEFGSSPPNDPERLYARRSGYPNVVLVSKAAMMGLAVPYTEFLDYRLLDESVLGQVQRIEVQSPAPFTLERQTNETWQITEPRVFAADTNLVQTFLARMQQLQAAEVAKEVVSEAELPRFGLDEPTLGYRFCAEKGASGTNAVLAQIDLGSSQGGTVYARRADETSVYSVDLESVILLPRAAFELRDRQLWSFSTNDVREVSLQLGETTHRLTRTPEGGWRFADDSQGIVNTFALEEALFRFGTLRAHNWVVQGDVRLRSYGLDPVTHRVTIALADGEQTSERTIAFGGDSPSGGPYALTDVDGQSTVIEFPLEVYYPYLEVVRGLSAASPGDGQ